MSSTSATLSVTYTSTTNPSFSVSESLTRPSDTSVTSKQTYLNSLRESIISVQERVNKELTDRMEQDNKQNGTNNKSSIDDAKEEENYGEEVVEEDD